MERPLVAYEEDDLQMCRVAASILSNIGQPTRGGTPACGLGEVPTTPHCKTSKRYTIHNIQITNITHC